MRKCFLLLLLMISSSFGVWPAGAFQFDDLDGLDPVEETGADNDEVRGVSNEKLAIKERPETSTKEDVEALLAARRAGLEPQIIAATSRILGKDPGHLVALNTLALHYFGRSNLGLAKIILRRALSVHPKEPALHNNLGIVFLTEGDQRSAISSFKKSLEMRQGYVIGATNLASIYLEYRDYNRALAPLDSGYKMVKSGLREGKEEAVGVANNLAVALSFEGQANRARDIYEEIGRGTARNITVLLNYATLLTERLKAKDDALKVISKIKFVADDPKAIRRAEELEKKLKSGE